VQVKTRQNRVFSVDLNPNYIGWCCTEWKSESSYKVIEHGVVDFKALNDKQESLRVSSEDSKTIHLNNKRKHELLQACKWLVNKAAYYQCSIFGIEDLNIKSSDKGKGKKFNRLCNNCWNRSLIFSNIQKRCNVAGIHFQKVMPNYSSFVGNFLFRRLEMPDMCLSAFEIGRRAYEFVSQYVRKNKETKKCILWPSLETFKTDWAKSLEEFSLVGKVKDLFQAYMDIKNSKNLYRVPLDKFYLKSFRFNSRRSMVQLDYALSKLS